MEQKKKSVLMFWIFRDKVCFSEAHYFLKSVKLKDDCQFNKIMGILRRIKMTLVYMYFSYFRVQNLEKSVNFLQVLA